MIYLNITLFETFTLTISETFTKKNPLQNLARFHGWLFELEILEVFTTGFLLMAIISTWVFLQVPQSALLKNEKKKNLKKDATYL